MSEVVDIFCGNIIGRHNIFIVHAAFFTIFAKNKGEYKEEIGLILRRINSRQR